MYYGVWFGLIGGGIGGLIGVYSVWRVSTLGGIGLAIFLVFIFAFVIRSIRPIFRRQRLLKVGIPGQAKILSASDTGMLINHQPVLKLNLEVQSQHRGVYQVETKEIIPHSSLGQIRPGAVVSVRIDPDDHMQVALG